MDPNTLFQLEHARAEHYLRQQLLPQRLCRVALISPTRHGCP
jgi:hypothetical protein